MKLKHALYMTTAALLAAALFIAPTTSEAQESDPGQQNQSTLAQPVPADDQAPPVVQGSSWGALKALYRGPRDSTQANSPFGARKPVTGPMNAQDRSQFSFPGGDWSSRVAWEARYALNHWANGVTAHQVGDDAYGYRWLADWDYINGGFYVEGSWYNGDAYALEKTKQEAGWVIGPLGFDGFAYRGGWCTFFARLILYRATYWAGYGSHLTMPNFNRRDGTGSLYDWCNWAHMTKDFTSAKPGWLAFRPPSVGNEHVAILDVRATSKGRDGWWLIDSNYVGGNGKYYIARHFLPMTILNTYYWAWTPTLATTN